MPETAWVVWSEEHGGWWTPSRYGYTRSLLAAGRFTEQDAKEIEANANRYLRDKPFHEIAMPDPLAGRAFRAPDKFDQGGP